MSYPIYLDYAATTPVDSEVAASMLDAMNKSWGNPSSHHRHGFDAARLMKESRELVAESVGASARELTFTSGATEAINLALRGYLRGFVGGHVVASLVEHKAVLDTLRELESRAEIAVSWVKPESNGEIGVAAVKNALRHDTCLMVFMWVNNETGIINPIEELGALARDQGIPFFCDATQAVGKIPVELESHCDMAVFSAHKIYGPKGIGALWVRKLYLPLMAALLTGGGQESGLRPGTENLPAIAGFGKACELIAKRREADFHHVWELKKMLLHCLGDALDARESLAGKTVPHILSLSIPPIDNQALIAQMRDVASISAGSACNSLRHEPSHVLLGCGLSEDVANSTVRVAFGRETSLKDVDVFTKELINFADLQNSARVVSLMNW